MTLTKDPAEESVILTCKTIARDVASDEISLFPTESRDSVRFTQDEILAQSRRYSELYLALIDALDLPLAARLDLPRKVSAILARYAIVPLAHVYFDRLLRVDRLLSARGANAIAVARSSTPPPPPRVEMLRALVSGSLEFNQSMLHRLAVVYDLPIAPRELSSSLPDRPMPSFRNHLATLPRGAKTKRAVRRAALTMMSRLDPRFEGRVATLSQAQALACFEAEGFLGFSRLLDLRHKVTFPPIEPDVRFRAEVLRPALVAARPAVFAFLDSAKVDADRWELAFASFVEFASAYYPSDLLEAAPRNLRACADELARRRVPAILSADMPGNVETIFFFAAAVSAGIETIGCQHGGHESYVEDPVQVSEAEYRYVDRVVTWGWTEFAAPPFPRPRVTILPSPWLSERRRGWLKARRSIEVKRRKATADFLFFPNRVYPFPPAPGGAGVSRVDHIGAFVGLHKELVEKAATRGFTIHHKPYTWAMRGMFANTYEELERLGGDHYKLIDSADKGLTQDLVGSCRAVLWDQPGTGFLECLAGEIPTMVVWPRIYNLETSWAKPAFAELEATGVVCRDVDSLLDAYALLRRDPAAWLVEPRRREAMARFSQEFARFDEDWPRAWTEFLDGLR